MENAMEQITDLAQEAYAHPLFIPIAVGVVTIAVTILALASTTRKGGKAPRRKAVKATPAGGTTTKGGIRKSTRRAPP
jgi:hypothetical protein